MNKIEPLKCILYVDAGAGAAPTDELVPTIYHYVLRTPKNY
jgi:hypothetical protein